MKRLLMTVAIACALSVTSMAGEIPSGGAPTPPPQQTASTVVLGEKPTSGAPQSISDAALTALMTALGLASI